MNPVILSVKRHHQNSFHSVLSLSSLQIPSLGPDILDIYLNPTHTLALYRDPISDTFIIILASVPRFPTWSPLRRIVY
jgi:hypothetical protein